MFGKKKGRLPYLSLLLIVIPALTVAIAFIKIATGTTKDLYVKIKVSQGLWWAQTSKPDIWLAKSIKKGSVEYDFLGNPQAEILEVRYYPVFVENQPTQDKYDIFITAKLNADYSKRTNKYSFKRTSLSIGTPIELETPNVLVTGTIIELNEKPLQNAFNEVEITLTNDKGFNKDNPYLYENIKVGDTYFDGQEDVFKILDKGLKPAIVLVPNTNSGTIIERSTTAQQHIIVKALVKTRKEDDKLIFAEEKTINVGSPFYLSTDSFKFNEDFVITDINPLKK